MPPAPRSRNGCLRCKSHRLKCDEATPVCGRCRRLGHHCSGPTMHLRWSNKHEPSPTRPRPRDGDGALGGALPRSPRLAAMAARAAAAASSAPSSPTPHAVLSPAAPATRQHDLDDGLMTWFDDGLMTWFDDGLMTWFDDNSLHPWDSPFSPPVACLAPSTPLAPNLPTASFPFCGSPGLWTATYELPDKCLTPLDYATSQAAGIQAERVHRPLRDDASFLVKVYFEDVAPIMSIIDGNMNPFRSAVSRFWRSSELLYMTLQSIAASFIAKGYPHLSATGLALREKVTMHVATLQDADFDEKALLCLLMIGSTSSWCNPGDLGLPFFRLFRQHLDRLIASGQLTGGNWFFFRGSLIAWEMLLSFVVHPEVLGPCEVSLRDETADPLWCSSPEESSIFPLRHIPHPWTGVAREAHLRVEQVGRLIRSNRHRARVRQFTSQTVILALQQEMARAFELEAALWAIKTPREADMTCPNDQNTPASHIHLIGEITRRVGLLQLYRVFPDVLERRAGDLCSTTHDYAPLSHARARVETSLLESQDHKTPGQWLSRFALDTVQLLKSVPADSGTCVFQLFLLVASCNELGPCGQNRNAGHPNDTEFTLGPHALSAMAEILQARGFIISRLRAILPFLAHEPVRRGINIVKATWERMDEPVRAASLHHPPYWMDVMMEKGWDTLMG